MIVVAEQALNGSATHNPASPSPTAQRVGAKRMGATQGKLATDNGPLTTDVTLKGPRSLLAISSGYGYVDFRDCD